MKQLIYRSQPFGFDRSILAGILMHARRNNPMNDITGALICRQDMYIQLVEGPDEAIDALYDRIQIDDRHSNVRLEVARQVEQRMFPNWEMLDDTEPSMTFSKSEISAGAIEQASSQTLLAIFQRIADTAHEAAQAD
ncbi:MAG: BLUF domain-containing protein [Pseudomonadota bacterium]